MKKTLSSKIVKYIIVIGIIIVAIVIVNTIVASNNKKRHINAPAFSQSLEPNQLCYVEVLSITPKYEYYYKRKSDTNQYPSGIVCYCLPKTGQPFWMEISISDYQKRFDSSAKFERDTFFSYHFVGRTSVTFTSKNIPRLYGYVKLSKDLNDTKNYINQTKYFMYESGPSY